MGVRVSTGDETAAERGTALVGVGMGSEKDAAAGGGAAAGAGAEALYDRVAWIGGGAGAADDGVGGAAEYELELGGGAAAGDPFSRLMSLRVGFLPLKYSEALTDGSLDGAGGKMSAWKESA